ncbi:hypothetical protein [Caballeronia sp. INDeC2]|uniref:hypothetical protein n=1 Tax=Caballeronia sp. INDeC2 TaxID=2921747 RepID=UPI002029435A|nr:hypothetical protein [Caballeronia sp. INDeC2]
MGAVVIGACFLIRAYFEQHPSTPRAGALPVAVAGSVALAAPKKVDVPPQRVVEAPPPPPPPANPSVETASPIMAVAASSEDHDTRKVVAPERSVVKKRPAARAQHTSKAAIKPASKQAAACTHKTSRACNEPPQRRVTVAETKHRRSNKAPNPAPVARAKTGTREFQKVSAIPSPVKPAMTADGSWKPSKTKN